MNESRNPESAHPGSVQLLGTQQAINRLEPPPTVVNDACPPRRRYLRLSPLAAIVVAAAGLALIFELENNRIPFRQQELTTVSPDEAVDISLKRLGRSRVVARFQRANRLNGSLDTNRHTVDAELGRIREHPLYTMIKERMTTHLRSKGYDWVTINATMDAKDPMLSSEPEITLVRFIHSLRASFPAPNDKVAAFLDHHEDVFGSSIVEHRGDGRYDATLTLLIQLLFEFPDEIEPVAGAVKLIPRKSQEIEQDFRGGSQMPLSPVSSGNCGA